MGRNFGYDGWAPYVPVAQRQRQARNEAAALKKSGHTCQPVTIEGRAIAKSFWGKAWCDNLESYSDYSNRLPRGRTYVRNGSVIDLRIETGRAQALVSGSQVYRVEIAVQPVPAAQWSAIIQACSGKVASLIELLQGKLSSAVMDTVTRRGEGLFPSPRQISLRCSCPDSAVMCKHVAAVLYGVGARLDNEPELLFRLRHVDPQELTRQIGSMPAMAPAAGPGALHGTDLSALFGIDLDDGAAMPAVPAKAQATRAAPAAKRPRKPQAADPRPPAVLAAAPAAPAAPVAPVPPAVSAVSAKAKKPAVPRQSRSKTVTAGELIARGAPRHMIQNWLVSGVLLRTEQRGVYRTTAQTEERVRAYSLAHPANWLK